MKKRGISLIVLVITIIIIIVLAGAVILNLSENNPINSATKASILQGKESLDSSINLYITKDLANVTKIKSSKDIILESDIVDLNNGVIFEGKELYLANEDKVKEKLNVSLTKTPNKNTKWYLDVIEGRFYLVCEDVSDYPSYFGEYDSVTGKLKDEAMTNVVICKNVNGEGRVTFIFSVDNTKGNSNISAFEGAEFAYNNPVIPAGFKTVNDGGVSWSSSDKQTILNWNDGLVIEDSVGNQFVWVPACLPNSEESKQGVTEYEKWLSSKNEGGVESLDQISDNNIDGIDENTQVTKYGGFYIARYEAGIPEERVNDFKPILNGDETLQEVIRKMNEKRNVTYIPVSKKNQMPWNYIDSVHAKSSAESMYVGSKVKSGLVTGTMWDTIMKWLENSGLNVQTDSASWGNYMDSKVTGVTQYFEVTTGKAYNENIAIENLKIVNFETKKAFYNTKNDSNFDYKDCQWLLKTGNTEYTKRKNIYDMAGNLNELISENIVLNGTNYAIQRGGGLAYEKVESFAARRGWVTPQFDESYNKGIDRSRGFRVALYVE